MCVHGIGLTDSPDTVANENLDSENETGPTIGLCEKERADMEKGDENSEHRQKERINKDN